MIAPVEHIAITVMDATNIKNNQSFIQQVILYVPSAIPNATS